MRVRVVATRIECLCTLLSVVSIHDLYDVDGKVSEFHSPLLVMQYWDQVPFRVDTCSLTLPRGRRVCEGVNKFPHTTTGGLFTGGDCSSW